MTAKSEVPVDVAGVSSGIVSVSAGFSYGCALTAGGAVKCWGKNDVGQLGNHSELDSSVPVDVVGLSSGVVAISTGYSHACAVTDTGAVKCWGSNGWGQLGNNSAPGDHVPVDVVGLASGVVSVSAGELHTCVVMLSGAVKCWGYTASGQLGNGTPTSPWSSPVPVDVEGLSAGVVSVSAGFDHTCAITAAGAVKCWGSNDTGQFGDGSTTSNSVAVRRMD